MEEYDVVVVGAGPAGCTAAYYSSRQGLKTLLVERKKRVGFPVQCGELMPTLELVKKIFKNLPNPEELFIYPENVVEQEINELAVGDSEKIHFTIEMSLCSIDREKFDNYLFRKAKESGAYTMTSTYFSDMKNDGTILLKRRNEEFKVKTKLVIGADGIFSTVAKKNNLSRNEKAYPTLQYTLQNTKLEDDRVYMFFDRMNSPDGFVWLIPKKSRRVNAGLGFPKYAAELTKLKTQLDNFISNHPATKSSLEGAEVEKVTAGWVPVGGPLKKTWSETKEVKVVLIGDAGGFVAAHNGAGVPGALITGKIAGEIAYLNIKEHKSISLYERKWRREVGKPLFNSLKILNMVLPLYQNKEKFEKLLSRVNKKLIEKAFYTEIPWQFHLFPLLKIIL